MPELRYYGEPVLRKSAAPVETFDDALAALANEMIELMREADGIGLAAPQIGLPMRLIVVDVTHGDAEPYILANPEIVETSDETDVDEEGCLSLPGISLKVKRPAVISVKAQNAAGEFYTIDRADGLFARALQHEIDHLNGVLTIDRVSSAQRTFLGGKLKKIANGQID